MLDICAVSLMLLGSYCRVMLPLVTARGAHPWLSVPATGSSRRNPPPSNCEVTVQGHSTNGCPRSVFIWAFSMHRHVRSEMLVVEVGLILAAARIL